MERIKATQHYRSELTGKNRGRGIAVGFWGAASVCNCGSDLALVRTRAERAGDHYLISGQKIFITYGEHDLAENIVHLVLARTPDAPEGVKGISLFMVPKFLVKPDGTLGERNARALRLDRAQARHPRQPDRGDGLRQGGRLSRGRGEPRPRVPCSS